MRWLPIPNPRSWLWPLLMGVGYFLTALGELLLTRHTEGIATIWPSSGILLAALLMSPWPKAWRFVLTAGIASMAANVMWGTSVQTSFGFSVANGLDSAVAMVVYGRRKGEPISFLMPKRLLRFCLSAGVGAMASAVVATASSPIASSRFFLSWACTDLLGMLIVTPMIVIAAELLERRRTFRPVAMKVAEAAGLLVLIAGIAGGVFLQTVYPLLFLPLATVLFIVFRLGAFGAAASVLIITLVSSLATAANHGPLMDVPGDAVFRILFLQLYLLLMFAAALPTASLLGGRDQLIRDLAEKNHLLQLAESTAHVGHWRFDTQSGALLCSDEIFAIYGQPPVKRPTRSQALDAYHDDDRAFAAAQMASSIATGDPFAFRARIIRPTGEVRYVTSRGQAMPGNNGVTANLFGTMQDITEQVTAELALDEARNVAERMAWDATRMAETDVLTGIFSRRKIFQLLDQAIETAAASGEPLSIAAFDIDHFKRVNDEHGHAAGDKVLQRVAASAASALRPQDSIGRVGGEEFMIILPGATIDIAKYVAERVRALVFHGAEEPWIVTVSLGVACWEQDSSTEQLLARADTALYDAKHAGRNVLRVAA